MAGTTSFVYFVLKRAMAILLFQRFLASAANSNLVAVGEDFVADSRRRVAFIAHDHDVGSMNRRFLFQNAAGLLRAARLGMAFDDVQSLDDDGVLFLQNAQDLAGLA